MLTDQGCGLEFKIFEKNKIEGDFESKNKKKFEFILSD